MSSATWARTLSMCALIARRSIATIRRWRLAKHAQQHANFTTFADRELSGEAISSSYAAANSTGSISVASSASALELYVVDGARSRQRASIG